MSDWRTRFALLCGPSVFAGITPGDWLALLRENSFRVHPRYWPRAAMISWCSLSNLPAAWVERLRYGSSVADTPIPPPLFVLGHWRSGTTLLHDLLSVDDRFACPNLYQVTYPHTFLTTERMGSKFMRLMLMKRRPQDNMRVDPEAAWEEEFAMCALRGFCSPCMTWVVPRRAAHYDRFLTFRDATEAETARWRAAHRLLLQKLSLRYGRPLVLKSPPHTARIKLLLESFPGARFVHIRRNPYTVFQSNVHLFRKILPVLRLQRTDEVDWAGRIIRQYREVYDAFFSQRGLIPPGQFHEVAFEDLEADPAGEVRRLYAALGLPDFGHVEPKLREYVAGLAGYRKNTFAELVADQRGQIAREWRRCFEEWGYHI